MTTSKKLRGMKLPPGYNARLLLDAAAEIDRLTRERDEARAERDALAKENVVLQIKIGRPVARREY